MTELLLLSNSTMPGEQYFAWAKTHVKDFLGNQQNGELLFIPYAGVTLSFEQYESITQRAFSQIGFKLKSIHHADNPIEAIENAAAIVIGGGNTFQLASLLQTNNLIAPTRNKVMNGTPYIGWSAGSNIACPTIMTTNDMPIVQPQSFDALNLVPFQINPHYTEATLQNHGGESREQRVKEYLQLNKTATVIGLPEGSLLHVGGNQVEVKGKEVKILSHNNDSRWVDANKMIEGGF
jgi:dipeptidase E